MASRMVQNAACPLQAILFWDMIFQCPFEPLKRSLPWKEDISMHIPFLLILFLLLSSMFNDSSSTADLTSAKTKIETIMRFN